MKYFSVFLLLVVGVAACLAAVAQPEDASVAVDEKKTEKRGIYGFGYGGHYGGYGGGGHFGGYGGHFGYPHIGYGYHTPYYGHGHGHGFYPSYHGHGGFYGFH